MTVNLSKDNDYHSQINNKRYPMSTCNTTSAIMALKANGISFKYPEEMQPEDYLTMILETKEAYDKLYKDFNWAVKDGYSPREVHGMLEWGINKLVGENIDMFTTNSSLKEVLYRIHKGKASLMTGRFTKTGHVICVVGFSTRQSSIDSFESFDMDLMDYVIIDDPYGDYHTGYKNHRGNNIYFPINQFDKLTKSYSSDHKWAHLIG